MSEVPGTVPRMTDNELQPPEHIYRGIRSLRGWDEALSDSEGWSGLSARTVGQLISAVLLAGGEDRMPVAIAGKLDENGTGSLAVLHTDVVVVATAVTIKTDAAVTAVSIHGLRDVTGVQVKTHHNYYDGTERRARHTQLAVDVTVAGIAFTFAGRGYDGTPLTDDDAAKAALDTLRGSLVR